MSNPSLVTENVSLGHYCLICQVSCVPDPPELSSLWSCQRWISVFSEFISGQVTSDCHCHGKCTHYFCSRCGEFLTELWNIKTKVSSLLRRAGQIKVSLSALLLECSISHMKTETEAEASGPWCENAKSPCDMNACPLLHVVERLNETKTALKQQYNVKIVLKRLDDLSYTHEANDAEFFQNDNVISPSPLDDTEDSLLENYFSLTQGSNEKEMEEPRNNYISPFITESSGPDPTCSRRDQRKKRTVIPRAKKKTSNDTQGGISDLNDGTEEVDDADNRKEYGSSNCESPQEKSFMLQDLGKNGSDSSRSEAPGLYSVEPNEYMYSDSYRVSFVDGKYLCVTCGARRVEPRAMCSHIDSTHIHPTTVVFASQTKNKNDSSDEDEIYVSVMPTSKRRPSKYVEVSPGEFLYEGIPLKFNGRKYTCGLCEASSSLRSKIGYHIKIRHLPDTDANEKRDNGRLLEVTQESSAIEETAHSPLCEEFGTDNEQSSSPGALNRKMIAMPRETRRFKLTPAGPNEFMYRGSRIQFTAAGEYECADCGLRSSSCKRIQIHIGKTHSLPLGHSINYSKWRKVGNGRYSCGTFDVQQEGGKAKCLTCSKYYKTRTLALRHVNRSHLCNQDDTASTSKWKLSAEGEYRRGKLVVQKDGNLFKCGTCGKASYNRKVLFRHATHKHARNNYATDIISMVNLVAPPNASPFPPWQQIGRKKYRRGTFVVKEEMDGSFTCVTCGESYQDRKRTFTHVTTCHLSNLYPVKKQAPLAHSLDKSLATTPGSSTVQSPPLQETCEESVPEQILPTQESPCNDGQMEVDKNSNKVDDSCQPLQCLVPKLYLDRTDCEQVSQIRPSSPPSAVVQIPQKAKSLFTCKKCNENFLSSTKLWYHKMKFH